MCQFNYCHTISFFRCNFDYTKYEPKLIPNFMEKDFTTINEKNYSHNDINLLENFSRRSNGTLSTQHFQSIKIMMSLMRSFMRHLTLLVTFLGVLFDMETGRVIWTTVPEMGDKVRPCVAICSLNADRFFYVPLSTVDYNTLWQVPIEIQRQKCLCGFTQMFYWSKAEVLIREYPRIV